MGDNRAPVYTEDDLTIYRASSIGGCTRALVACRLGFDQSPTPAATQAMFDAGNKAEDDALKRLIADGHTFKWPQKEYYLHVTSRIVIRAHIDAMTAISVKQDVERVVEVKSQSQDAWDGWKGLSGDDLWRKYDWQFSVVMHATGKPLLVVRINRDDPTCDIDLIRVDEPPKTLAEIRARVLQVEATSRKGVLPDVCDHPMFPCPVWRTHPEEEQETVDVPDPAVDAHARAYLHTRALIVDLEKKQKDQREKLRHATLDDRYRTASGIVVSFVQAKVRRFSEKMMRDRGLDPEELKEEVVSERINVKGVDEDAARSE